MASLSSESVNRRTQVLTAHLRPLDEAPSLLSPSPCLNFSPPEVREAFHFDSMELRRLIDGHNLDDRDWLFGLMLHSSLFNPVKRGSKVFLSPDFNQSMEQQREVTMRRILYLRDRGVFRGCLTSGGHAEEMRTLALMEAIAVYDHSLSIKLGVHFALWGGAIKFFGTKKHHDKWLKDTEEFAIVGCFAMTELGHGSNVRGIETVTTYDPTSGEFIINTPCESAQKYWIGGAAKHATHAIVFSQLIVDQKGHGVHAFVVQIRGADGNTCPNVRVADCGHKIGLNGVDNGRIWFDNVRVPRDNLLNSVADVSRDGKYISAIADPDQRFAAFLAPLTSGRVNIAISALYSSKVSLSIAIRYSLSRRAFSLSPKGPEVLLLDYPSHQQRLFPLLAKTCVMSFAGNYLKQIYVKRTSASMKQLHVFSSAFKAVFTWHNMRTLQECREACGGQGLKTENRIGQMKGDYDVQSTFEGDNNVLMQQVSKALIGEYVASHKRKEGFKGLGLEHMNKSSPILPTHFTSSTLRSVQFQIDIFCLRERDILERFVSELLENQSHGRSREQAFVMSYQIGSDLTRAFSERAMLQIFVEEETTVLDVKLKKVMELLRSMYTLICIEEDASFLRYGYLSTDNADYVRKELRIVCEEMRPHSLALVNSLGIPDSFLSPIAFDWVHSNTYPS